MSSKDKTGDKLIASMRKSKTGAVSSKTSKPDDADKPVTRSTPAVSKAAPTKTTSKTATSKPASATSRKQGNKTTHSSGQRVWPD